MAKEEHIHSIVRSHYTAHKKSMVFKCNDPVCMYTVTIPKNNRSLLIGRASTCPDCGEVFILDSEALKRKKPVCLNCSNSKTAREFRRSKDITQDLINQLFPPVKPSPLEELNHED